MRVEVIEKVKGEDLLKIENFLEKMGPTFDSFQESYRENPLEVFLEYPLPFYFDTPLYWDEWDEKDSLIVYEKGKAFIDIDRERLLFSFDWKTLYQEIAYQEDFLSKGYSKKNYAKKSIYESSSSKEVFLPKVKSGKDLVSALTHATWLWLEEFSSNEANFMVFLPFSFYPFLKEPSTNSSWDNIQEELRRRLNVEVHLTPSLKEGGLLVDKNSLSMIRSVNPCYFLGLDEQGNRKLFIYLDIKKTDLLVNSYSLNFSLSSFKGNDILSSLKKFTTKSIILFSILFPISWHLIDYLVEWVKKLN